MCWGMNKMKRNSSFQCVKLNKEARVINASSIIVGEFRDLTQ